MEADTLESETSSAEPVDGKVTFEGVTFELPSDYISLGEMEEMGIPMVGYQYGSTTVSVVAEDISTFPGSYTGNVYCTRKAANWL